MTEEALTSVGIDIGTSTTQCVFSLLRLTNSAPNFAIPRIEITEKSILHRGPLRLTPMRRDHSIDLEAVREMVLSDYAAAGIRQQDVQCGAAIITGEVARKRNAPVVLEALSEMAGDFVVSVAGPELEGIYAGRGSGAAALSIQTGKSVLNFDIGGGTANMCLFEHGEPVATGCLDVGGRLIRFDGPSHNVIAFSDKASIVAQDVGVPLRVGERLSEQEADAICRRMAEVLEEAANLRPRTALHDRLVLAHALPQCTTGDFHIFSGGVADCVYGREEGNIPFHDIGKTLGQHIRKSLFFTQASTVRAKETQHATVIGAGAYSMALSGSTICYDHMIFPIKNLQVGKIRFREADDMDMLSERIREQRRILGNACAIGFDGISNPSYCQIEQAADLIAEAMGDMTVRILICVEDMAKALGQALIRRWGRQEPMLCLDGVSLAYGDMVSIGAPLSGGRVVPVVVKTLAFSSEAMGE